MQSNAVTCSSVKNILVAGFKLTLSSTAHSSFLVPWRVFKGMLDALKPLQLIRLLKKKKEFRAAVFRN